MIACTVLKTTVLISSLNSEAGKQPPGLNSRGCRSPDAVFYSLENHIRFEKERCLLHKKLKMAADRMPRILARI